MRVVAAANKYLSDQEPWKRKDDPDRRDTILHTALQVVQDANTLLTPFLPHSAQKVHEALGGTGVWAAQPEIQEVDDLGDGPAVPVLTGDYAGEQARWESTPIEVGRPLAKPTPIFTKLDPELGETGPEWAPIAGDGPSERRGMARRRRGAGACRAPGGAPGSRRARRSRCRRTSTPTRTSTPAARTTPRTSPRPWTGPPRSGVTRVVTVADDLAVAPGGSCDAAHWDDRVVRRRRRCTRRARPRSPTPTAPRSSGSPRDPRVVAVGETGLDYYWDYSPPAAQQEAFRWHIDLAKRARQAADDPRPGRARRHPADPGARRAPPATVVFHCFSGDAAMARTCVDAGYVLSFAGPVTFKNAPRAARGRRAGARRPAARRDRRARSSPRTRTAAGPTSRTACRGRCAALAAVRGRVRRAGRDHAPGVTPSGCFGSVSCRPVRRFGHIGRNGPHVRRSGAAVRRSRRVAARPRPSLPVTVP